MTFLTIYRIIVWLCLLFLRPTTTTNSIVDVGEAGGEDEGGREKRKRNRKTSRLGNRSPYNYAVGNSRRFENYNYRNLSEKMSESTEGMCTFRKYEEEEDVKYVDSGGGDDFKVFMMRPSQDLIERWRAVPAPYTLVDDQLCNDAQDLFQRVGCGKGVALHPDSPRCHRDTTGIACALSSGKPAVLPEAAEVRTQVTEEVLSRTSPFVIKVKNARISRCGGVALECGILHMRLGCGAMRDEDARDLKERCFPSNGIAVSNCSRNAAVHDRVFVLSYKYDSAIGHFLVEVLPRLIYFENLLKDPNVMIHYGCDKKFGKFSPPLLYLNWLGIAPSRLIQGEVVAKEVIVPRDGACQDALWNRWELLQMRVTMLEREGLAERLAWRVPATTKETNVIYPVMVCLY